MKTIRDIAQSALDVQNACNLSGVVHSFSALMTLLSEQGLSSEEKNRHPAVILYSNKIASLCGSESGGGVCPEPTSGQSARSRKGRTTSRFPSSSETWTRD